MRLSLGFLPGSIVRFLSFSALAVGLFVVGALLHAPRAHAAGPPPDNPVVSFAVQGGQPATETIAGLVVRPADAVDVVLPAIVFGELISAEDVDAFHVTGLGDVIFSTTTAVFLPDGTFQPSDLVMWDGSTYSLYFDGATLLGPGENIDAMTELPDGTMLISTSTGASVFGFSFSDGDVVQVDKFNGTANLYMGLDEATLFTGTNQNIDALHYDWQQDELMLSVLVDGVGTAAGVPYATTDDLFASVVSFDPATPAAGSVFLDGVGMYDGATRQLDAFFLPVTIVVAPMLGPVGVGLLSATIGVVAAIKLRRKR